MNRPARFDLKDGRHDAVKFILPSILSVILFFASFFWLFLPAFQNSLLEKKKEGARELTRAALHILDYFARRAESGDVPLAVAQDRAVEMVRAMRYGREDKDYFWINDLRPVMVMHPYRIDLEGRDLAGFIDAGGRKPFLDFVEVASRQGSGYVPYVWQWQDRPERQEAKLSHVQLFSPWGWVVGTGIYLEEVEQEVADVSRRMTSLLLAVSFLVLLLSAYVVRHGMRTAAKRRLAEEEVCRHKEHLEVLVRQRTEALEKALAEVKQLSGFLPICASCKKIRDDEGYWQQIEVYIRDRSEARFSHGICPDCAERLYPGLGKGQESRGKENPRPSESPAPTECRGQ